MKKLFSMLLILGICASVDVLAHGPPGHADQLAHKFDKKDVSIQMAAMEKYSVVEIINVTCEQALHARPDINLEPEVSDVILAVVSSDRETGRPPTLNEHWRVDRSRFRRCDMDHA